MFVVPLRALIIYHTLHKYSGPVFTKLFMFRMKIRLKFKNEYLLEQFPLSVQENMIYVYMDMGNGILDLKRRRLKYMLETIKYSTVDTVIQWAHILITVATIKLTLSFIKKLRIPRSLVRRTYLIKYQQPKVEYLQQVLKKVDSKIMFKLSPILILILKSFVNTWPGIGFNLRTKRWQERILLNVRITRTYSILLQLDKYNVHIPATMPLSCSLAVAFQ